MRNALSACLLAALLAAPAISPVSAREVERQEVAEAFAEDVPQERRLYCRDTKLFILADGREYRACIDWRAQNRTQVARSYAALDGPEVDTDANLDLARTCFELAVASQNDPYRESFDEDLFLAGARSQFNLCARARGLDRRGDYSLRIYQTTVWLGGR